MADEKRVRVKEGYGEYGKVGVQLGPSVWVEQSWTPVLWNDEEDPNWFKTAGLEVMTEFWRPAKAAERVL